MATPSVFDATDIDRDSAVQVESVRTVLLSAVYPPGEELTWVGGVIRSWDAALVEVTLSDGTTGLGEVGAGIMAARAVPGIVEELSRYLVGVPLAHPVRVGDHLRDHTAFWSRGGLTSGAIGALETACVDAVAKRLGVPAHALLGGTVREKIEVYASGGLGTTFEHIKDWAHQQVAAGLRTVKFRAMRDPATTIALLDFVVPSLPARTRFVLDAVQGCASTPWAIRDCVLVGEAVAAHGGRWYEEPCRAENVAGYVTVRAALPVAISGVESHGTFEQFRELITAGGVDIAQPDVTFVGGFRAFHAVADLAAAHGVDCVPHVWGSGVTLMANLHASLSHANVRLFEYCTLPNPLRDALLVSPPDLRDGMLATPTAPGLGVRLTPQLEDAFPFQPGAGHVIR
ncbi:D-galactarolactone cycloisomerase [Longispora fulva]|uniref:L-alanine-DL-glutamate epimerase-like enolase superfamily enzyme n=1 Tax=Longispora fulva TaxID=619741 RepID=A0A8J7G9H9_9ACTN|nr:mandelate racemase/muconate lactonizing enzyme family protein [Longispora fulva]MBG6134139.1 L-alanine-DL-glutamate epimerase-like enolase superfamily enzyme [Longispora fulva]GIG62512.1 D-galactarolactone cycloisomerase [Longispora fulva]